MDAAAASEKQPSKDSLGEKVLNWAHKQYEGAVDLAFGRQVHIPFTDRKMSRAELWLGLPLAAALISGEMGFARVATDFAAQGVPLEAVYGFAHGWGLLSAAAGAGVGVAGAIGIEAMSAIRSTSEKIAK